MPKQKQVLLLPFRTSNQRSKNCRNPPLLLTFLFFTMMMTMTMMAVIVIDVPVVEAKVKLLNFFQMIKNGKNRAKQEQRKNQKTGWSFEVDSECVCPPEDTTYIQQVQKEREVALQEHVAVLSERVVELQNECGSSATTNNGGSCEVDPECVCPPEDTTYIQQIQKAREMELQEHVAVLTERVVELQNECGSSATKNNGGSCEVDPECVCPPEDTTYIQQIQNAREVALQEHVAVLTERVVELQNERDRTVREQRRVYGDLRAAQDANNKLKDESANSNNSDKGAKLQAELHKCQANYKDLENDMNKQLNEKVTEHQRKHKELKAHYQEIIASLKKK